jgi:hypothetical protein
MLPPLLIYSFNAVTSLPCLPIPGLDDIIPLMFVVPKSYNALFLRECPCTYSLITSPSSAKKCYYIFPYECLCVFDIIILSTIILAELNLARYTKIGFYYSLANFLTRFNNEL